MHRRRNGQFPVYDGDKHCFMVGEIPIYDGNEFIGLQLKWIETNANADADAKETEWNRLLNILRTNKAWEWKQEYIRDLFNKYGKMYLPSKYYNRLLRMISE